MMTNFGLGQGFGPLTTGGGGGGTPPVGATLVVADQGDGTGATATPAVIATAYAVRVIALSAGWTAKPATIITGLATPVIFIPPVINPAVFLLPPHLGSGTDAVIIGVDGGIITSDLGAAIITGGE